MVKLKNTKEISDTWCGQTIASLAYYELQATEVIRWQNDSKVLTDIGNGNLLFNDGTTDFSDVATAINKLKEVDTTPRDADGSIIHRQKAAKAGWSYQLHALEFTTSTIGGIYNKDYSGNDLGFASVKLYDAQGTEITDQQTADTGCVKTQLDWCVNHEMEIVGASLFQAVAPQTDIRMWTIAAPGIVNISFVQGGANLKHAGTGHAINADGRAAKYMHPTLPIPGCNKFRMIFKHDAGVKHAAMFLFDLFKP